MRYVLKSGHSYYVGMSSFGLRPRYEHPIYSWNRGKTFWSRDAAYQEAQMIRRLTNHVVTIEDRLMVFIYRVWENLKKALGALPRKRP